MKMFHLKYYILHFLNILAFYGSILSGRILIQKHTPAHSQFRVCIPIHFKSVTVVWSPAEPYMQTHSYVCNLTRQKHVQHFFPRPLSSCCAFKTNFSVRQSAKVSKQKPLFRNEPMCANQMVNFVTDFVSSTSVAAPSPTLNQHTMVNHHFTIHQPSRPPHRALLKSHITRFIYCVS